MSSSSCFSLFDGIRDFIRLLFLGNEIRSAVQKCRNLAEKSIPITKLASERGVALLSLAGQNQTAMRGLGEDTDTNRGLEEAPKIFLKIQHLLDDSQIVESIADCKEMAKMAKELVGYTNDMANTLQKAIDSLPEHYQDDDHDDADGTKTPQTRSRSILAQEIEDEDDVDTQEILKLLTHIDADIQDVYASSNQARGGLDIFTASTMGSKVFELTQSKGQLAIDLFRQMSNLNTVLADGVSTVLADSKCCIKLHAAMKSVSTLLRSQKLVKVLVSAATAVERLMDALEKLVEVAWQKMQGFLEQFAAAKKLGKFVKDVKGKLDTGKGVLHHIRKKGKDAGKRMFGI